MDRRQRITDGRPGTEGICPGCSTGTKLLAFENAATGMMNFNGPRAGGQLHLARCPICDAPIVGMHLTYRGRSTTYLLFPRAPARSAHPDVPSDIAEDYEEAGEVLRISPKASAALSRRCLQNVLRSYMGIVERTLFEEIEKALPRLPSYLQQLHDIRDIGNFAAHPGKDTASGVIIGVEPGEAEWMLDVLDQLFDHVFVHPARATKIAAEVAAKKAAAKP